MADQRARNLRANMTDAEQFLWSKLRRKQLNGYRFRRQHPLGPYIVDFVCLDQKLIVEVDGGQHNLTEQAAKDAQRTSYLKARGFGILRFWNNEVLSNGDGVVAVIAEALKEIAYD
jgi:very-short-patch-repair endonuclease